VKKKPKGPKVLYIDIETRPLLAWCWGLWDQNIGLNQIEKDWSILSYAAKWADSDKVLYKDLRGVKDTENDTKLLKDIWKLLDLADVVIYQNGRRFDKKKINARFIMNDMKPPSSFKDIDTYCIAQKYFGFTSHKLEYMTDKLCTKYKKLKNSGFELWKRCMKGDTSAWKEMEKYNKHDVLSLEELYSKLRPWDTSVNFNMYHDELLNKCTCGTDKPPQKNGYAYTKTCKYQRYKCVDCGVETRGRKNLLDKDKSTSLTVGTNR
jgi:uncharacterized protein YprB with RNaseH-like and TPR domain